MCFERSEVSLAEDVIAGSVTAGVIVAGTTSTSAIARGTNEAQAGDLSVTKSGRPLAISWTKSTPL